jgi:hypothetical protein
MAGTGDELGHVRPDQRLENDVLEGGEVEPLQDYPVAEQHRANTARYLAYALVGILALSVLFQYVSTMTLIYTGKVDAVPNLDRTFNTLLPLLSGLVGGATTYYFTRKKR